MNSASAVPSTRGVKEESEKEDEEESKIRKEPGY